MDRKPSKRSIATSSIQSESTILRQSQPNTQQQEQKVEKTTVEYKSCASTPQIEQNESAEKQERQHHSEQ